MLGGQTSSPNQDSLIKNSEYFFTKNDLHLISDIIKNEAGIVLSDSKASLVYSRLAKRIRKLGMEKFSDYCSYIKTKEGEEERKEMLAALTTNVTSFFREPHHFDHLRNIALPDLIKTAKSGGRVRIWSAACSSGQEAYSIGLTLLSMMPDANNYDIRILATDIDKNILAKASDGTYEKTLISSIPINLRSKGFKAARDQTDIFRVSEELRKLISFRLLNLIGDWPMKGKFNAIFCRNVVIYFDGKTQEALWPRLAAKLDNNGVLYVGHSERIPDPSLIGLRNDGMTTYAKIDECQKK